MGRKGLELSGVLGRWNALGLMQGGADGAPDRFIRTIGRPIARAFRRLAPGRRFPGARLGMAMGMAPTANDWFARGMPVHRYYLERFLAERAGDIRGHCLEFQEDSYTSRFGGSRAQKVDILHKENDAHSAHATLVADLTAPNDIPSDTFDCIICTYVLHLVFELERFVAELHRILAPDGVLLVAVPNITIWYPRYPELWRFTPEGLRRLLARSFGEQRVQACSYGNSLTAAGELRGLVVGDFAPAELNENDERYGLVTCARAVKAGRNGTFSSRSV